jgi:uncharacterized protein YecA (UPF0149 family)
MENLSNTMLVSEQRLIELLLHKDKRVRDEAASALERYFPKSRNVIKHLLKAFYIYEGDTLCLTGRIKSFLPDEEEIHEILKVLTEITSKQDENLINIYSHLMNGLYQFPYDLITDHKELFVFNEHLKELYEIITKRNQIKSRSPKILWTELSNICKQNKGKNLNNSTGQYVDLLVEGLLQYGDEIKHKVIMSLSQETTDYHFELYMVQIAGGLKIQETVPYLFRILIDSDFLDIVNDECTRALGKIGGREVVGQVELLYPNYKDIRPQLASILESIPYNYSEDLVIRLLKNEADIENKTFLAESLCGMFSLKAAGLIIEIIENEQYAPSIVCLSDLLVPIYEYHHQAYNLTALQNKDHQFSQEKRDNDPLRQLFSEFTDNIIKQADNKNLQRKVGRNEPCPCGSGKKYKKCCLNNGHNSLSTNESIPRPDIKQLENDQGY